MKIKKAEYLLEQISIVNRLYKRIIHLSGENFNIFKIIGLVSEEVRVHSSFIAELLNPAGSHGQDGLFLNLFIKELNSNINLNSNEAFVEVEKSIGIIKENEGGRIDIFIFDKSGKSIIIENKIWASDQENQLIRYDNFGKKSKCPYELLYLTLDGKEASEKSVGNNKINYKTISYKNEIIHWLETCQKEVGGQLVLREGITHYINLIKYLTNQTINHSMESEIENLLKKSSDNLESALLISNSIGNVKYDILIDFWDMLKQEFNKNNFHINETRAEELERRTRKIVENSSSNIEGYRIKIKEDKGYHFYWGGDILNFNFISGFYIRKYEHDKEILPITNDDYTEFEEYRNLLNEYGFNNFNKWWFAFRIEQDLNFKSFTPTVCSFVEKEKLLFYVERIVTEAINGIKVMTK